jgi:Ca2+:H+ antiporter
MLTMMQILLLVYFLYLLFQLNSHAYMYESTPQEVIERETRPGPAAQYFESSSSSDDSSSSSSDTDDSSNSGGTRKKIQRAMKSMKKRKDSTPKTETIEGEVVNEGEGASSSEPPIKPVKKSATEPMDQTDGANPMIDLEAVDEADGEREERRERRSRRKHHHKRQRDAEAGAAGEALQQTTSANGADTSKRVDFAAQPDLEAQTPAKPKPFALRAIRPTISKRISQNVFAPPPPQEQYTGQQQQSSSNSNSNPGLRRANSLPVDNRRYRVGPGELPPIVPVHITNKPRVQSAADDPNHDVKPTENISRTSAILLLLGSTGLVALCAEFMVDSINEVVAQNSAISEAFIGLILLPIVGNAAEHVTAVTVALKNKMDLAIGVAVGSSIQIALFVTPLVVILGWIMNKEMSLFFTIFETVSLFVSAFIVNFLVLDGRSNYLEGALLCAAYVIIGTAAFFYPDSADASDIGGGGNDTSEAAKMFVRSVAQVAQSVKLW